jgi:hypothetical protein
LHLQLAYTLREIAVSHHAMSALTNHNTNQPARPPAQDERTRA